MIRSLCLLNFLFLLQCQCLPHDPCEITQSNRLHFLCNKGICHILYNTTLSPIVLTCIPYKRSISDISCYLQ